MICFDFILTLSSFRIDQCHQESCEQVNNVSEMTVQRLLLELETGGNVRFEDGKPSDPWYSLLINMWVMSFHTSLESVKTRLSENLIPNDLNVEGLNFALCNLPVNCHVISSPLPR